MSDDKRNFGLRFEKLSSRPADDGGFIQRGGSRDADTQYPSINSNVVFLPRVMASRRPSNLPESIPVFSSTRVTPFERSNMVQAPIDMGVLMFWISYFALVFVGLGFASWALLKAVSLL